MIRLRILAGPALAAFFMLGLHAGCHRPGEPTRELAAKPGAPQPADGGETQQRDAGAGGTLAGSSQPDSAARKKNGADIVSVSGGPVEPGLVDNVPDVASAAGGDALVAALEDNGGNLVSALDEVSQQVLKNERGDVIWLILTGPRVTDATLRHIKDIDTLGVLDLGEAPITDRGLRHIGEMTQLRALGLRQTKITDDGLKHLSRLQNLQELNLELTAVGDAGIKHLAQLDNLRRVCLYDTEVSGRGVNGLQIALPLCRIAW